jgi:hypothetical protein
MRREPVDDNGSGHGRWTETQPCLANEPRSAGDGSHRVSDVVREPDWNNVYSVAPPEIEGVIVAGSVYSSNLYRYGAAMAAAIIDGWERIQMAGVGQEPNRTANPHDLGRSEEEGWELSTAKSATKALC